MWWKVDKSGQKSFNEVLEGSRPTLFYGFVQLPHFKLYTGVHFDPRVGKVSTEVLNCGRETSRVQKWWKLRSNVRPKRGPKTGLKPRSKLKKSRKTSKLREEFWPKKGAKSRSKSQPKIEEKYSQKYPPKSGLKSGSNHCKRLIYLAFGAVPLNYFLLQFYTRPQISPMRAQRAPVPQ